MSSMYDDDDGLSRSDKSGDSYVSAGIPAHNPPPASPTEGLVTLTPFFMAKRHLTCGIPKMDTIPPLHNWRSKEKLKTANACLLVCLNIGIEPPDVVKTSPYAKMECWIDPFTLQPSRALDAIGKNLQAQFESLNPRLRYKPCLDPTMEDMRKFLGILRKTAKDERALLYYNGHGVPKPTTSGEIWAFNAKYTQYVPVSLVDVQNWVGSPTVCIWDCSAAGNIVNNWLRLQRERDGDRSGPASTVPSTRGRASPWGAASNPSHDSDPSGSYMPFSDSLEACLGSSIHLAACLPNETLPMAPQLPADIFTSCLTSPIEMALRYFILRNVLPTDVTEDMVMQLPGDLKDRRSPLGELNWIFTSVTDTIAWTTFSRDLFLTLFRNDLMIAALFRNFLLAERIMRQYSCTPVTHPVLPSTFNHPMWDSWDMAVDTCLSQLPSLLRGLTKPIPLPEPDNPLLSPDVTTRPRHPAPESYYYEQSPFFSEHLTAFEVWLGRVGSSATAPSWSARASLADPHPRRPPEQLPTLLQVLLAQAHRLRALVLLSQFVDLGPWAVHFALVIGMFPYVQRLLQSPAPDLKPVLVFVWARVIAVERSTQVDLLRDNELVYFAGILAPQEDEQFGLDDEEYGPGPIPNGSEHRAMCAFILAMLARDYVPGQAACFREGVFDSCLARLDEEDYLVKQWCLLCMAAMLENFDEAKAYAITLGAQDRLVQMRSDESAEVRAATMFTLGIFLGCVSGDGKVLQEDGQFMEKKAGGGMGSLAPLTQKDSRRMEVGVAMEALLAGREDASPLVRKELVVLLSAIVVEWRAWCVLAAWVYLEEDRAWRLGAVDEDGDSQVRLALEEWFDVTSDEDEEEAEEDRVMLRSFFIVVASLFELSVDPHPVVAELAQKVVDYILSLLYTSPFARIPFSTLHLPLPRDPVHSANAAPFEPRKRVSSLAPSLSLRSGFTDGFSHHPLQPPSRTPLQRTDTRDSLDSATAPSETTSLKRTASIASTIRSFYHKAQPSAPALANLNGNSHHAAAESVLYRGRPSSFYFPGTRSTSPHAYEPPSIPPPPSPGAADCPNVVEVIRLVVQDDFDRLRHRRRKGYTPSAHSSRSQSPSSSYMDEDDARSWASQVRLDVGEEQARQMPLTSTFFDWSKEYYQEPQMKRPESEEPGSLQYNEQMFRKTRNEQMALHVLQESEEAMHYPWDHSITQLHTHSPPLNLKFHQFETLLGVTDEHDLIAIWDWSEHKRITRFANGNPKGTGITSLHFINEDILGMVLTTSSEGVVRVHRNYHETEGPQLISSWRAIRDITSSPHGSGIISDWHQGTGTLIAGGDSTLVRVWNAGKEICVAEFPTDVNSCLTSISTDGDSSVFVCGFGNGAVQVFDHRLPGQDAIVTSFTQHRSWVQNVHWQKAGHREILSASVDGEVRLWDVRAPDAAMADWRIQSRGLSSFAMHQNTDVFATTSQITAASYRSQTLQVHALQGIQPDLLTKLNILTGLHGPPSRPSLSPYVPFGTTLAFHRNEMMFAIGGPEGTIRVMGLSPPKQPESPEELYDEDEMREWESRSQI